MTKKIPVPLDFATLAFGSIDVVSLARELLQSEQATRDGRAARTLAKSEGLKAVLTVVPAGGAVGEHAAPGPVVIVPMMGNATFSDTQDVRESHPISVGQALFVAEGQKHRVSATQDCAFLVIIGSEGTKM